MFRINKISALALMTSASLVCSSCGVVETVPTVNIPVEPTTVATFIPVTTTSTVTSSTTVTSTTTSTTTTKATTAAIMTTSTVANTRLVEPEPSSTAIPITESPTTEPPEPETVNVSSEDFIGTFSRGTYYTFGSYGGSGRTLVSGYSIASRALYERYGYGDYKIRIECDEFPELNGVYSLDDCSAPGNYEVIDFWFAPGCVPSYFQQMGVLEVRAYIVY